MKKFYRRFRHNIEYKDGYSERMLLICVLLLIIDLILLYMVK